MTKVKQYKTKQNKKKREEKRRKQNKKLEKYLKIKICLILHTTTNWCLVYVQDFKATKFLKQLKNKAYI